MTQITVTDLNNAKLDVDTIADIANDTGVSVIDRLGATRLTANEAIRRMGYQVPVTYASSLVMSTLTQTVDYLGVVYAPLPTMIPFTTSGTFETTKFYVIQNNETVKKYNTYADLLASGGAILDGTRADMSGYSSIGDGLGNDFVYSSSSTATHDGKLVVKPTAVSGAGRWLALNSAQIMTDGKTAKMMVCAIRNTGSGWAYIEDSAHAPIRFTGAPTIVTAPEDFKLTLTHTTNCGKVGSLVCAPDETFAPYGVVIGASVGTDSSTLRAGMPLRFRTYGATAVADFHPFFGSRVSIAALGDGTGFTITTPQLQNGTATTMPIVGTTHYIDGRAGDIQIKSLSLTQFEVRAVGDIDAYLAYNGSAWVFTSDTVANLSASWSVDTLTVTHDSTGVANLGVFTQQIFGGYRPVLVSSNANSCSFKFVNDAGVVQTTLSTAFKFRFTRPHKLPKLMPATQTCYFDCGMALLYWGDIISANGNIWLQGLMHN